MNHEELVKALDVVHRELADSENLDAAEVEQLRSTMSEIQSVLDANQEPESLSERVGASAQRFETSHPKLTETLSNLVDILQRMGF